MNILYWLSIIEKAKQNPHNVNDIIINVTEDFIKFCNLKLFVDIKFISNTTKSLIGREVKILLCKNKLSKENEFNALLSRGVI